MTQKKPQLLLIDGYGLIFRAYYTIREMSYRGQPTNALFGFVLMILKLMERKPDAMLIALDWHGEKDRKKEYADYKAHRQEAPDDLRAQIARLRELIEAIGINWIEVEGQEADDVIGSLAKKSEDNGYDVFIVSGDLDLCQLVEKNIKMLYTVRGTTEFKEYDIDAVKERFGVEPSFVPDYKGLVGDPSDNIPGVRGVGEKTAKKLLEDFHDLDNLYSHLNKIEQEKLKKTLEDERSKAFMSRKLATIRKDLDINLPPESKDYFHREGAAKIFAELGFRSFIERLGLEEEAIKAKTEKQSDQVKWHVIQSMDELDKLISKIKEKGSFAIDIETSSLDARTADLAGISVAINSNEGYYLPLGHTDADKLLYDSDQIFTNLPIKETIQKLSPLIQSPKIEKIAQNAKFEYLALANHGVILDGLAFDTYIASYLLNPDERHNLKELGLKWMKRDMQPIEELIGSGKKQKSMCDIPIEKVAPYAVDDASVTWGLESILKKEIKNAEMENLYYNIELPLVILLAEMEREGIRIDPRVLKEISRAFEKELDEISKKAYRIIGRDINLNSPQQLSELLFKDLKLSNPLKGSTNIEVLEEIKSEHPLIPLIIEHRSIMKLRSTYAEGLLAQIDPKDGKIHTSFNQALTSTGRLSSSEPNLQNIPIRTERGREIRKAFLPNYDDEILLSADYSQIELRLLAHYSKDEVLIEAFKKGEDIHNRTAKEIIPLKSGVVTPEDRRMAKIVNFGIIYGMSAFSLSKDLGISRHQAQEFIDNYFARYPKVKMFFNKLLKDAREKGYVETFFGRRRYMPELNSKNQMKRSNAERAAINMPLQGGVADIMKKAMIELREKMINRKLKSRIILQVHDEIVLNVPKKDLKITAELTSETFDKTCKLEVPLLVHLKYGKNWYDLEELKI